MIVGSLPALKVLVTNRGSANRSYGSSSGRKQHVSNSASLRSKSIKLGSLSDKKSEGGRCLEAGDSQEDMLKSDGAQFVLVRHDVVSHNLELDHTKPNRRVFVADCLV